MTVVTVLFVAGGVVLVLVALVAGALIAGAGDDDPDASVSRDTAAAAPARLRALHRAGSAVSAVRDVSPRDGGLVVPQHDFSSRAAKGFRRG